MEKVVKKKISQQDFNFSSGIPFRSILPYKYKNIIKTGPSAQIYDVHELLLFYLEDFPGYKKFKPYFSDKIKVILQHKQLHNKVLDNLTSLRAKAKQIVKQNLSLPQLKSKLYSWIISQLTQEQTNKSILPNTKSKQNLVTFKWMIEDFLIKQSQQPRALHYNRNYRFENIIKKAKIYQKNKNVQQKKNPSDLFQTNCTFQVSSSNISSLQIITQKILELLEQQKQTRQKQKQTKQKQKQKQKGFVSFYQYMGYNLSMLIHFIIRAFYSVFEPIFKQIQKQQTNFYCQKREINAESKLISDIFKLNPISRTFKIDNKIPAYYDQITQIILNCIIQKKQFDQYKVNLQNQFIIQMLSKNINRKQSTINEPMIELISIVNDPQMKNIAFLHGQFMKIIQNHKFYSIEDLFEQKLIFFHFIYKELNSFHKSPPSTQQTIPFLQKILKYIHLISPKIKIPISQLFSLTTTYDKKYLLDSFLQISILDKMRLEWQKMYFITNTLSFVRQNIQTALIIEHMPGCNEQKNTLKIWQSTQLSGQKQKNYEIPLQKQTNFCSSTFQKVFKTLLNTYRATITQLLNQQKINSTSVQLPQKQSTEPIQNIPHNIQIFLFYSKLPRPENFPYFRQQKNDIRNSISMLLKEIKKIKYQKSKIFCLKENLAFHKDKYLLKIIHSTEQRINSDVTLIKQSVIKSVNSSQTDKSNKNLNLYKSTLQKSLLSTGIKGFNQIYQQKIKKIYEQKQQAARQKRKTILSGHFNDKGLQDLTINQLETFLPVISKNMEMFFQLSEEISIRGTVNRQEK